MSKHIVYFRFLKTGLHHTKFYKKRNTIEIPGELGAFLEDEEEEEDFLPEREVFSSFPFLLPPVLATSGEGVEGILRFFLPGSTEKSQKARQNTKRVNNN